MLVDFGDSGLRFREFDFPHEVEIQQPFQHVIELQIGENLLRPAQVFLIHSKLYSAC